MKGPTSDAHKGREASGLRLVNPATERGSTVLFPSYAAFRANDRPFRYGRAGTPTHRAFEESLCVLEAADAVTLAPSGLSACVLAIMALTRSGGHLLVTDSVYSPTRDFCDRLGRDHGVETTYYDPLIGAGIAGLIRPETVGIFCESPGSLTFEVQDLPAIIAAAGDVPVIVDNTYGAGVHLKPLTLGAAMSVQAITKYVGGHSDLLMGSVATSGRYTRAVQRTAMLLGLSVSPDDVTRAHRGLRTLHRRLDIHEANGLALAEWLAARPEVVSVLHPGLPGHPQHELFRRDFSGSCGLFSAVMDWDDEAVTGAFIDALGLFGLGYSWGGYESLCLPAWPQTCRTATPFAPKGQLLRFHAGLEALDDLTADLEQAFHAVGQHRQDRS
jgi:cystathionine beta-lyase